MKSENKTQFVIHGFFSSKKGAGTQIWGNTFFNIFTKVKL